MEPCQSILVVEDEREIRESIRETLEDEGYSVRVARNGKEALEMLEGAPRPVLILLDLLMPVMNGWDFIEAVRGGDTIAAVPIVIISAFENTAYTIKNANGFIRKPVDMRSLMRVVETYCLRPPIEEEEEAEERRMH